MAVRYITLDEFEEFRKGNTAFLDNVSQRINALEQSASNTSVRLSGIETQLSLVKTDVASLRSEMHAEFTKVNTQLNEVRHMMAFLITHLGFTLPEQPESPEQPKS